MIENIVTIFGDGGNRTSSITLDTESCMYKVVCERFDVAYNVSKHFMNESDAQKYAQEFAWEKEYGTV